MLTVLIDGVYRRLTFILDNNLETIFQKMYYTLAFGEAIGEIKESQSLTDITINKVGETHGNAEFSIFVMTGLKKLAFDLSFQNGLFKFALSSDYWKDKSKKNIQLVQQWTDELRRIGKEYGYNKFNDSKGRARISVSTKISDNWPKITKEEFVAW